MQRVNEVIPPLAGTKTDGQIVVDIMNRMGIPQPDYTPDCVLAEIARVVPFFKGAVWEKLGDKGKQWPIQEGCIGTEILHTDTFKRGLGKWSLVPHSTHANFQQREFPFILPLPQRADARRRAAAPPLSHARESACRRDGRSMRAPA